MSFFPSGFDPRGDVLGLLHLVNINTVDGDFGFMLGADGAFTDINGKRWVGSTLIGGSDDELSIGGTAPAGQLTLTFFQDPSEADVVSQIMSLGSAYVSGRPVTWWVQPVATQAEFYAPVFAPILRQTRDATTIDYKIDGPQGRALILSYEGPFARRKNRRGLVYNQPDHEKLIGESNPSLSRVPTKHFPRSRMFG